MEPFPFNSDNFYESLILVYKSAFNSLRSLAIKLSARKLNMDSGKETDAIDDIRKRA